jgi:antitoxin ParD1/3/4
VDVAPWHCRVWCIVLPMSISLPKEQLEWLEAEVAAGHFSSIDEALSLAVAELQSLHENDLTWANPYVDEARDQVARGETLSGNEFFTWLDARIEGLQQQRD